MAAAAHKISRFSLDAGNVIVGRADAAISGGVIYHMITNSDPSFSFDPEADIVATYGLDVAFQAGTEVAISLLMTDGTTNITLACLQAQYKAIPEGDREGIQIYECECQCNHSSGNDAVTLTATGVS